MVPLSGSLVMKLSVSETVFLGPSLHFFIFIQRENFLKFFSNRFFFRSLKGFHSIEYIVMLTCILCQQNTGSFHVCMCVSYRIDPLA